MNTKRYLTWGIFGVIVILIIWGLIAAEQKASREIASVPLPSEIVSTDHIKGNPNGSVTLVEYSDFQCPACKSYFPLVEQLVGEFGSTTLRFVYRHFPLPQHPNAVPAAEASEAAAKQGKFWEMYKVLFEKQENWETSGDAKSIFITYAQDLGLDVEKFTADMNSEEVKELVNTSFLSGKKADIQATPTFYLNGKSIVTPQTYDEFKTLIQNASATSTNP